jgi:carnitine-CoA ligase
VRNLAELLVRRTEQHPEIKIGTVDDALCLGDLLPLAGGFLRPLREAGIARGMRVVLIGESCASWFIAWVALQLGGMEAALINPNYPDELLTRMLNDLRPQAVIWIGREAVIADWGGPAAVRIDGSRLRELSVATDDRWEEFGPAEAEADGLDQQPSDIAGYMHTSGTTGDPKFCAQSHEYFLRLGRFFADTLALSGDDTVIAPLPMHHINPLGYGVVGGLVGHANVFGVRRFSASKFWPDVRSIGATVLVLHQPPVEILKRRTNRAEAGAHQVRAMFFADEEFLRRFQIPLGISAYGSTEGGGLSHVWTWRKGEQCPHPEGMAKYSGRSRADMHWKIDDGGEILVRGARPGVFFSGYGRGDRVASAVDKDGWFRTGDVGRTDHVGNLVFMGRRTEAIRVKGEYVPVSYVEERFAALPELEDLAVWLRPGLLGDDEVVLFIVASSIPRAAIAAVCDTLPPFMCPRAVARVAEIARDTGVGKIRRRDLSLDGATEIWEVA